MSDSNELELKNLERREQDLQAKVYKLKGQRTEESKKALSDLQNVQGEIAELRRKLGK